MPLLSIRTIRFACASAGLLLGMTVVTHVRAVDPTPATNAAPATVEPSSIAVEQLMFETKEPSILLKGSDARWQLQLTAITPEKQPFDVTRLATIAVDPPQLASVDASGLITPLTNGTGKIKATFKDRSPAELPSKLREWMRLSR